MPELPDLTIYRERLEALLVGQRVLAVTIASPFLVRTVDPKPESLVGQEVRAVTRIGKRLVLAFADELALAFHLMIAGRLHWKAPRTRPRSRADLMSLGFAAGSLLLTEQGSKRRASVHVVRGEASLRELDRGGLEVMSASREEFASAVQRENRTLKRALTDPRILAGIGNAYSDEILHAARMSPMTLTSRLDPAQIARLHEATVTTLQAWTERLRVEAGAGFPEHVTAFRHGMAVHGRYRQPCPVCSAPVQRIRYADNECNYCAECQCEGKLLADRGLSTLMRKDWPKTLAEMEEGRAERREP